MSAKMMEKVGRSFFSRGEGTLKIPFSMHKDHRQKLCGFLQGKVGPGSVVVVQGGSELPVYDTDTTWDFRQESNFQWLFGAKESGLFGALEVDTGRSYLFIPKLPAEYAMWMGPIRKPIWFQGTYEVDEVHYSEEMAQVLQPVASKLLVLEGVNHDSGSPAPEVSFPGISSFTVEKSSTLYSALAECRVIKDSMELEIMQFVNDVSSEAHIHVMREVQGSDRSMEYHAEAAFKYQSFIKGCSRVGYCCICPGAERNATLHYGCADNPNQYKVNKGDLKLHDMGAEYHGYTADITVTFPIGGRFSPEQKVCYDAVWAAVVAVEEKARPGVNMADLHQLSHRVLLQEMVKAGLLEGDIEEMMAEDIAGYFSPTGLGHQLGLDVHDVGGYLPGEGKHILRELKPYPINQNLRFARPLQEGMVFTVEPGLYFNEFKLSQLMSNEKKKKFVNMQRLEQLKPAGGVRIEDNVVVTASGCKVLTNVPRTTDEIERVIAGEEWKVGSQGKLLREYKNI